MAENENGQDKTEEPTDKKREDSRKEGQIARSKELNTLVVTMAGAIGLLVEGDNIAQMMSYLMTSNFTITREMLMDPGAMAKMLLSSGKYALIVMLPFFGHDSGGSHRPDLIRGLAICRQVFGTQVQSHESALGAQADVCGKRADRTAQVLCEIPDRDDRRAGGIE